MMRSVYPILAMLAALFAGALPARASLIWAINLNTASLAGVTGYVDFQFNPGFPAPTDSAFVLIGNFTSDGFLSTPAGDIGDVSGSFPGTVQINNSGPTNDHAEGFTFGTFFAFEADFEIPTISGSANSGSSFLLELLDDSFNPILTSGALVEIQLDENGNPTVVDNSPASEATITALPEPSPLPLLILGMVGILAGKIRRRRRSPESAA